MVSHHCPLFKKLISKFLALASLFLRNSKHSQSTAANEQYRNSQNNAAVITGFADCWWYYRGLQLYRICAGIIITYSLNCEIGAALAVIKYNGKGVIANRQRCKIILAQRNNRRSRFRRIVFSVNELPVHLHAGKLAEFAVCTDGQGAVAILRPRTVGTIDDRVIHSATTASGAAASGAAASGAAASGATAGGAAASGAAASGAAAGGAAASSAAASGATAGGATASGAAASGAAASGAAASGAAAGSAAASGAAASGATAGGGTTLMPPAIIVTGILVFVAF